MNIRYGKPIQAATPRNSLEALWQSYKSGRIKREFETPSFKVKWPSTWELTYESSQGRLEIGVGIRKTGPRWYQNISVVEIPEDLSWNNDKGRLVRADELPGIIENISQALAFFRVDHEFRRASEGRWTEE